METFSTNREEEIGDRPRDLIGNWSTPCREEGERGSKLASISVFSCSRKSLEHKRWMVNSPRNCCNQMHLSSMNYSNFNGCMRSEEQKRRS